MPPKRKAAPTPTGSAPKRASTRVRQPPRHPGDDSASLPIPPVNHEVPAATAESGAGALEALRREVDGRLTEFDATQQANTQQLNDIATAVNNILQRMDTGLNQPNDGQLAEPMATASGNDLPSSSNGILSRWPWVDLSLADDIANGKFDIYDLPKLHRDEYLRNRHIAKSVDGVMHPLSGKRPHIVQAKTKLQSSFKDFQTFLAAWNVYVAIRSTFEPERGPGLVMWTERINKLASLQYEFTIIVNYIIAYFQAHQNRSPETWFHADSELHSDHFGNAAQQAFNTFHSQPVKPSTTAFGSKSITLMERCKGNGNA